MDVSLEQPFDSGVRLGKEKRPKKTTQKKKQTKKVSDDASFKLDICMPIIGFIDADYRSYVNQIENEKEFVDDMGKTYVLDDTGNGYFDEKRKHFNFDDTHLLPNKTPHSKQLVKEYFFSVLVNDNPINHPIKRLVIVVANDIALDDNDSYCEEILSDEEFDEDVMDEKDEPKPKAERASKKSPHKINDKKVDGSKRNKSTRSKIVAETRIDSAQEPMESDGTIRPSQISVSALSPNKIQTGGKVISENTSNERKNIRKLVTFESGDEKGKPSKTRNDKKFSTAKSPDLIQSRPISFHRKLANNLHQMNVNELTELFLYVDENSGGEFVKELLTLLEELKDPSYSNGCID